MLKNEEFSTRAKVDRYGRQLPKDSGRKELEKIYRIEEDEGSDDERDEDEEVELELKKEKSRYDPARGGGFAASSSDESSSEEEEEELAENDEVFGFPDLQGDHGDGIPMGEVSSRIAVVNLDWDNIRAADLMAVFSSFVPSSGQILKVSIYPSDFGKERMEREEMEGPPKAIFAQSKSDDPIPSDSDPEGEEDDDEMIKKSIVKEDRGEEFNSAQLRHYQLERLRYYYAVLTCSSVPIAQAIYDAVDGTEYLTTANFFDLRFIPDEMEFFDDKPRDECDKIPDGYRPNEFVTDALQHSKVRLTWDADDGARKEIQKRAFAGSRADINENDLKAYLGSDSSEDEEQAVTVKEITSDTILQDKVDAHTNMSDSKEFKKDAERQRMRALLGLQNEPALGKRSKTDASEPVGDVQITFSSGLSAAPNKGSVFENEPVLEETTVEKYVRKGKERKARRKDKVKSSLDATELGNDSQDPGDQPAAEMAGVDAEKADLGFSDPFFTAPADDKAAATSLRKEQKRQKCALRAADEAAASAKRAELELLMVDDKASGDIHHFDINEIARAEKAKKKKRKRLSEREKEALEMQAQDRFRMDVEDSRFSAVFERSEFAIDPTNPRFKETEGMKALLEEGRKKRRRRGGEEGGGEEVGAKREKEGRRKVGDEAALGSRDPDGELQKLVARVKGKTRKS